MINAKNNNIKTRKMLDSAVEVENMEEIKRILKDIPDIKPELSYKDFSDSIRHKYPKEENKMKINYKIPMIAAIIAVVAGATVGASALIKQFTFNINDKYVTVSSNSDISSNEAKKIAEEAYDYEVKPDETNTVEPDRFNSISEAEAKYNMKVIIPEKLPDLELNDVSGSELYISDTSKQSTIWVDYGNINKEAFALTVVRYDYNDSDITSITSTDAESKGEHFISERGYEFNVLKDSDEESGKTANIMTANMGEYEYSMVFVGFDKSTIEEIVNSVDLESYR